MDHLQLRDLVLRLADQAQLRREHARQQTDDDADAEPNESYHVQTFQLEDSRFYRCVNRTRNCTSFFDFSRNFCEARLHFAYARCANSFTAMMRAPIQLV
jgi:hypothetical protein